MATGLESWSTTAATNATADSAVNWAEGMAPSAVNDSGRGMMQSAAKWRKDNNGSITTGGTSTAYTATSNQTLTAIDGTTIVLQMSATSGATPTLAVDSIGAKAIQGVSGTAIGTGALLSSGVYEFIYRTSPDAWIVRGRFAPNEFASGVSMLFYADSAPTGWTIVTTSTDDRALRVVSGSGAGGGTGGALAGTTAFTTIMAARTITASHLPDHTVTITDTHQHTGTSNDQGLTGSGNVQSGSQFGLGSQTITTTATTGSIAAAFGTAARGGAQSTIDFAVKYASVIICTKA